MHGHPLVYLDNAATAQRPRQVVEAVTRYYTEYNANVHRALYALAEEATAAYEESRQKVAAFVGADDWHSMVFTRSATEAINLVAYAWGRYNVGPGDELLVTEMEHHSNLVPWQLLARDTGATMRYIPLGEDGRLELSDAEMYFSQRTKLLAVVHQSNVLGTVNPVAELAARAREAGALVLVDGAQSVPHSRVNVEELGCDFLAFSGHKMLGPTGVGVLYARPELLRAMEPFQAGGEMIGSVTMEGSTWNEIPWKFEAGTPNVAQVIGLGAAVDYLEAVGIDAIAAHVEKVTGYAREVLGSLPGVTIYNKAPESRAVISFNLEGVHPHDLAQVLDQEGIAVRAGHHCAQPIMRRLGVPAMARASFYLYNTTEEADRLAEGIRKAAELFRPAD